MKYKIAALSIGIIAIIGYKFYWKKQSSIDEPLDMESVEKITGLPQDIIQHILLPYVENKPKKKCLNELLQLHKELNEFIQKKTNWELNKFKIYLSYTYIFHVAKYQEFVQYIHDKYFVKDIGKRKAVIWTLLYFKQREMKANAGLYRIVYTLRNR